jgi:hypothetical protein
MDKRSDKAFVNHTMVDSNICECGHPICGTSLQEHHSQYGCLHVVGMNRDGDSVLCGCKKSNPIPNRVVFKDGGLSRHAVRIYGPDIENENFHFSDDDRDFLRELKISL